jgi:hypothetical protein
MITLKQFALFARKFVAFYIGCLGCFLLRSQLNMSAVFASCVVGLLGTLLPIPEQYNPTGIQAAMYAGSFAGMCSLELLKGNFRILILSATGSLVYLLLKPAFKGFGGKLGAVALVASFILFVLSQFIK